MDSEATLSNVKKCCRSVLLQRSIFRCEALCFGAHSPIKMHFSKRLRGESGNDGADIAVIRYEMKIAFLRSARMEIDTERDGENSETLAHTDALAGARAERARARTRAHIRLRR